MYISKEKRKQLDQSYLSYKCGEIEENKFLAQLYMFAYMFPEYQFNQPENNAEFLQQMMPHLVRCSKSYRLGNYFSYYVTKLLRWRYFSFIKAHAKKDLAIPHYIDDASLLHNLFCNESNEIYSPDVYNENHSLKKITQRFLNQLECSSMHKASIKLRLLCLLLYSYPPLNTKKTLVLASLLDHSISKLANIVHQINIIWAKKNACIENYRCLRNIEFIKLTKLNHTFIGLPQEYEEADRLHKKIEKWDHKISKFRHGISENDLAKIMGLKVGTINSHIHKAKNALKEVDQS